MVRSDLAPSARVRSGVPLDGEQKLVLVLQGASDVLLIKEICEREGISEAQFHEWREPARTGAAATLQEV